MSVFGDVGVERFGAGDAQHDGAEGDEGHRRLSEQEQDRVVRRERLEDRRVVADVHQAEHGEHHEPDHHHGPEQLADLGRAVALEQEERGEHHEGDRHDPVVQSRRRDGQALDRAEHRDRRRDHAVAEEDRGAEDAEKEQPPAQIRPVAHRLRGEREHRDQAAFPVVVGTQDQDDVLDRDDHGQRPEHEREDAVDVVRGERHVAVREHLLQGVERTRADVAVDDADGTEREDGQARRRARRGALRLLPFGDDRRRRRRVAQICTFVPSSTTRFAGRFRKSEAAVALRCMLAKSFSRHAAMPLPKVGTTVARDRKYDVVIGSISMP